MRKELSEGESVEKTLRSVQEVGFAFISRVLRKCLLLK